jgi:hypothetical protein
MLYRSRSMPRSSLFILALLPALGACASSGSWPSLAYRPGEHAPGAPCDPAAIATAESAPPAPSPATQPAAPEAPAPVDLAAAARDLAAAKAEWSAQREKAEEAVEAAAGSDPGESRWATAQLELTRLDAIGSRFGEIANRLAVPGIDAVTPPERAALLQGAEAARAEHLSVFDALRARLAPTGLRD